MLTSVKLWSKSHLVNTLTGPRNAFQADHIDHSVFPVDPNKCSHEERICRERDYYQDQAGASEAILPFFPASVSRGSLVN